jgi:hypothetical protein
MDNGYTIDFPVEQTDDEDEVMMDFVSGRH